MRSWRVNVSYPQTYGGLVVGDRHTSGFEGVHICICVLVPHRPLMTAGIWPLSVDR